MSEILNQINIDESQVAQVGKIQLEISRAKELKKSLSIEMNKNIEELSNPIRIEYQSKFMEIDEIVKAKEKELLSL